MPISQRARDGLAAVALWNPNGARTLLAILKEHPEWVKHKDDRYGPLGLVLFGVTRRKEVAPGITVPTAGPPMTNESLAACEALGSEWRHGTVSVQELADALGELLHTRGWRGAAGG